MGKIPLPFWQPLGEPDNTLLLGLMDLYRRDTGFTGTDDELTRMIHEQTHDPRALVGRRGDGWSR